MRMSQAKQARYYNCSRKNAQFQTGNLVQIKTHPLSSSSSKFSGKLAPKWEGPAEIKSKTGPINYTVCWSNPPRTDVFNVVNLWRGESMQRGHIKGNINQAVYCLNYLYNSAVIRRIIFPMVVLPGYVIVFPITLARVRQPTIKGIPMTSLDQLNDFPSYKANRLTGGKGRNEKSSKYSFWGFFRRSLFRR